MLLPGLLLRSGIGACGTTGRAVGGPRVRPDGLLQRRGGPREDGRARGITGLLAGLSQLIPAVRGHAPRGLSRGVVGPRV
eukprot:7672246-Lingulodinium_polyedra.AAC.1